MKINIPRLEIPAEEAKTLMEQEGDRKVIKDDDKRGHIWMPGYNSNAITYFEPDSSRLWDDEWNAKGWIGTSARGWRTKDGDTFARVELIYVGEEEIKKTQDRFGMYGGCITLHPWGVPQRSPAQVSEVTVERLQSMTPDNRFRAIFRENKYYDDVTEADLFGELGLFDPKHVVAIMPRKVLEKALATMGKHATYEVLTLSDLKIIQDDEITKTYYYAKEDDAPFNFNATLVEKGLRVYYPRLLLAKYAPLIKVHYPSEAAPIVLRTEDPAQEWVILVAPHMASHMA